MKFGVVSDRLAQPEGVEFHERKGYIGLHTPSRRDYRGGNKIVLNSPPPAEHNFDRELSFWHEEFGAIPALDYLYVQWEGPPVLEDSHWSIPDHSGLSAWGMEQDCVMVLGETLTQRPLTEYVLSPVQREEDWEGILDLALQEAQEEQKDFFRWQVQAARQRVERCSESQWWVVKDRDLVVGSGGIIIGDDVARFQEVRTRPKYRRQGIAGHLCGAISKAARERFPNHPLVIVAAKDESPMRIYQRLGFETKSYLWTLTADVSR